MAGKENLAKLRKIEITSSATNDNGIAVNSFSKIKLTIACEPAEYKLKVGKIPTLTNA